LDEEIDDLEFESLRQVYRFLIFRLENYSFNLKIFTKLLKKTCMIMEAKPKKHLQKKEVL
jgi:hypothetical protein